MTTSNAKSKKRSSVIAILLSAALIITGAYAFLTATTATKVNNFTVGNIKVELDEGPWEEYPDIDADGIPDAAEEIVSGQILNKAPSIKNTGANNAYGFVLVSVPKAESAVIAALDGTVARDENGEPIPTENVELFELLATNENDEIIGNILADESIRGKWTLINDYVVDETENKTFNTMLAARENAENDSYNHYLFAYSDIIAGSAYNGDTLEKETSELFSKVRFANVTQDFAKSTAPTLVVNVNCYAIQVDESFTSVNDAWVSLSGDQNFEVPEVVPYA